MKVVFPFDQRVGYNVQPLGVRILSSILKQAGHEVQVVESDLEAVRGALRGMDPKRCVLAFSSTTAMALYYLKLLQEVRREFDVFTVMGGVHPTYYPETIEIDGLDAVCLGEGEWAMLDLVQALEAGEPVTEIPNWWVKTNGEVRRNPLRPLVHDLDEIPFPDRTIFRSSNQISDVVMCTRGCPYGCTYCFNQSYRRLYGLRKAVIRFRSVENVIEELKEIKARDPGTYIDFVDDILTFDPDWFERFALAYRDQVNLPYICNVRANYITPEIARLMKLSNCHTAALGVEAGNDHIRNVVLKRHMSEETLVDCCRALKENGIRFWTYNIVGLPGADVEKDFETITLNHKLKPDATVCLILQPYKGTEIYEIAREAGMIPETGDQLTYREDYGATGNLNVWRNVWHNPQLVYPTPRAKMQVINISMLFGVTVEFPWLLPVTRVLVNLPLSFLYRFVRAFWWKYCWVARIIPLRLGQIWGRLGMSQRILSWLPGRYNKA